MSEFTLAPPQSAETIAGFRDGQPWLVIKPTTTVRECRRLRNGAEVRGWNTCNIPLSMHAGGPDYEHRERTVPVQVPDPVPCPECGGYGWTAEPDPRTGEPINPQQCRCLTGSVQRPLLVPTWQCRSNVYADQPGGGWVTVDLCERDDTSDDGTHERRLAGVVLHPNPVYLPVWDEQACGTDLMAPEHVCHDNGRLLHHLPHTGSMFTETEFDITDQFSTPPPVGALLVDMSDAVWLEGDDVITHELGNTSGRGSDGPDWSPLSASTTLTTIEVPNA